MPEMNSGISRLKGSTPVAITQPTVSGTNTYPNGVGGAEWDCADSPAQAKHAQGCGVGEDHGRHGSAEAVGQP